MIIDDSDADQFLTEAIIKKTFLSIEIHQAYDGEEALETLDSMDKQPSLILLDINMPGMNGFEFLDEYSKREKQSKVIAMLTSSEQEQDKIKALQHECVHKYLVKPLGTGDLESLSR